MSSVFMIRRGAGGSVGGAWAVLSVSYPVGSLCTVSGDGIVLQDMGRDGVAFFALPAAGEWTAAITDGEREASKTVTVTERGELVRLLLCYAGDSLFAPGEGTESLWQTSGAASAGSESIVVQTDKNNSQSFACLKEPVSLAGATALVISAEHTIIKLGSVPAEELKPTRVYIIPEDTAATDVAHAVRSLGIGEGSFTGENACRLDLTGLDPGRRYYVTIRARVSGWDGGTTEQAVACICTVTGISLT
ncbi:MAG: hypothetical protein IJQ36_07125 [Oscillospiraceae bacterium]|nr:hypothetical protein [Oscillospiraceae bacterium]